MTGKYAYVRVSTCSYVGEKRNNRLNFLSFIKICRYRNFFVRYDEPTHVKHLKVELLPLIANEKNAKDIASELIEVRTYLRTCL